MDYLHALMSKYHLHCLTGFFSIGTLNFILSLLPMLEKGTFTLADLSTLGAGANGLQMIVALVLLLVFKNKKPA